MKECLENVTETMMLFAELGFVIRPIKSNLIPSAGAGYPRLHTKFSKHVSQIGKIVSSFPEVMHRPLYYRNLEEGKN